MLTHRALKLKQDKIGFMSRLAIENMGDLRHMLFMSLGLLCMDQLGGYHEMKCPQLSDAHD